MRSLLRDFDAIAASDAPVLLTGESGTGKELVACALHRRNGRRDRPFVALNCAAFPETLLEAELFGYERGAFTGALRRRVGRFEAADGGTLFLDEVAEMSPATQTKLLRVLQEGTVEPLGTNQPVRVDVRIVSATHRDLKADLESRRFRRDLYHRLKVLEVRLPPLRERREDLAALVRFFLQRFAPASRIPRLAPRVWAALAGYAYPGNVRELEHALQHAVVMAQGGPIQLEHLPPEMGPSVPTAGVDVAAVAPLRDAMCAFERQHLVQALRAVGGRRTSAARMLGISRKSLWEKIRMHRIETLEYASERAARIETRIPSREPPRASAQVDASDGPRV
jgi:DNA-binding NtrC family response regulator